MRNIYVLPTNKTSRLIHNDANQLCYQSNNSFKNDKKWMYRKAFNIYITNDEKPKQGEWSLYQNKMLKCIEDIIGDEFKKIILTTDQDLIKDGVQAIDDEFLKWFVKNPSCDFVKTDSYQTIYNTWLYKIIIPKQEKLEEAAERVAKGIDSFLWKEIKESMIYFAKWQQEQDNEVIQDLKDRLDTIRDINATIIKAVEKLKEQYDIDVINAFNEGQALSVRGKLIQGKDWFEKFKKK